MSFSNVSDKYYAKYVEKLPSLEDKVVAITGTTSGTGYWTAIAAIRKNARAILLLNRDSERARASLRQLEAEKTKLKSSTELVPISCDLMSFKSVEEGAQKVNELCRTKFNGLNILANNAGIMMFPDDRTKDGYDVQMQTNHLSHFLLTKLLMPSLEKAAEKGEARICQHSSMARKSPSTDLKPDYFQKCAPGTLGGAGMKANFMRYHQTKLANTTFAMALHKKLQAKGLGAIKSVVAEPGVANTELVQNMGSQQGGFLRTFVFKPFGYLYQFIDTYQSASDGALPLIEACFGRDVNGGDFFYPKQIKVGVPFKAISQGKLSIDATQGEKLTLSEKNQERVWTKSEEALGPFFSTSKL